MYPIQKFLIVPITSFIDKEKKMFFLAQDPIQDPRLYLVVVSLQSPLSCNSSPSVFVFHDLNILEEYKPVIL